MKNIIFDFGGVLISWNPDNIYKEYYNDDPEKIKKFYQDTNILQVNSDMDAGKPLQEALTVLANNFPEYREPIYMWQTHWLRSIEGPMHESIEILKSLHSKNYQLYGLTNWAAETFFTHIRHAPEYDFMNLFNDIVVSGVEKVIKPDPKIYQILLERNKLNPADCIFIDDNQYNIVAAKDMGITTIQFISAKQLAEELHALSL